APPLCRVPRRATAPPSGIMWTVAVTSRCSWPARRTAPGARRSGCPARASWTGAGPPCACRGRGGRRGTAPPAGGYRGHKRGNMQAFVVNLTNGTWGRAIEVPGAAALNTGGDASVDSVSCVSAGNCTAVGNYRDGTDPLPPLRPFAVRQTNGTWGQAITAPG